MSEHLILPGSVLIVLLAFVLYVNNRKFNRNILFHSLFLIIYAVWAIVVSLLNFGGPVWLLAILLNNVAPLYYLSPVFFYFFVRTAFSDSIRYKKTDLLHFIPFLINLVAVVPYLLTSFDYKLDVTARLMQNYEEYNRFDFGLFYPPTVNLIARPVIFMVYMILSLVIVRKFQPRYKSSTGEMRSQYRFMIRTVTLEVIVFTFFSLAQLLIGVDCFLGVQQSSITVLQNILLYTASLMYLAIPVYILLNPRFIYGLPQVMKNISISEVEQPSVTKTVIDACKVNNPDTKPENEVFGKLSEKIMEYINTEKPYLNDKFSVHDLCIQLNVPRHHVQYCLNKVIGKSFTQLKNEQRVTYAMELMKNQSSRQLSIEGIGQKSGFISNSNFYSCFREITGMTPSKWMEAPSSSLEEGEKDHLDIHLLLD